jgi:putative transposase
MIDHNHPLPISRQAKAVGISRGSVYYLPRPVSEEDMELMRRIDRLHLDYPFAGSRMLRDMLRQEGFKVGRTHVATLMKRMGIEALYRKPRTTRPKAGHKVYPYLLGNLTIDRPNQVWAMDITYIPWHEALFILPPWSTGPPVGSWPGGSPSPWTFTSAWRRLKKRLNATEHRRS